MHLTVTVERRPGRCPPSCPLSWVLPARDSRKHDIPRMHRYLDRYILFISKVCLYACYRYCSSSQLLQVVLLRLLTVPSY
jgi:hypothetical protein